MKKTKTTLKEKINKAMSTPEKYLNGDMKIQQAQLQKLLETTFADRETKEKKFEKVVEGSEYLPILFLWVAHVLSIGFGVFFYFKQPDAGWHLFVFGVPSFILSLILVAFIVDELEERKVYWREIK